MANWHPLGTIRHPLEGPGKQYVSLILSIFEANLRLPELFLNLHIFWPKKIRIGRCTSFQSWKFPPGIHLGCWLVFWVIFFRGQIFYQGTLLGGIFLDASCIPSLKILGILFRNGDVFQTDFRSHDLFHHFENTTTWEFICFFQNLLEQLPLQANPSWQRPAPKSSSEKMKIYLASPAFRGHKFERKISEAVTATTVLCLFDYLPLSWSFDGETTEGPGTYPLGPGITGWKSNIDGWANLKGIQNGPTIPLLSSDSWPY